MSKGKINVSVENIFPLIKKFLYSDHEIFLRELISNATDATLKLKHLTSIGDAKVEYGNPRIEIKVDKEGKKIHILDQGLGMTSDEVEKYINQVAFSGAEEFLNKYEDGAKDTGIIGHFGLGFYSAFMVAEKVEIIIVPEFLTMLRGVIDSPDIPLNVSRSYLQADGAVKKISSYITRKVADKLSSLFKNSREDFEAKWNDIKIVIEYGMLSEDKFFEKADKFALYPTVDSSFFTFEELQEKLKANQTDKDNKLVILYASDKEAQHSYIEAAKTKGYEVLLMDSPIIAHLMQKLEGSKENISFTRVDADHVDNLIKKEENQISKLSDEEKETLKKVLEETITNKSYTVQLEAMDSAASPFIITEPEFMRRMKEMQQSGGGGMFGMGNMPEMYNLIVNTNHELVNEILTTKTAKKKERLINQSLDLARLSKGLLKGAELTEFIKRSYEMVK